MSLKGEDKLAWVIQLENSAFQEKLELWFDDVFSDSKKNELLEKHFGHTFLTPYIVWTDFCSSFEYDIT
jgi:membrane-bound lytic murein transglycosylase MltF